MKLANISYISFVFSAVFVGAFAGCAQGVGDRCQVSDDCQSGLICVIPASSTVAEGGTCQPPNMADLAQPAAADMTGPQSQDGGADLTSPMPDQAMPDLAMPDLAMPDLLQDLTILPDLTSPG